MEHRKCWGSPDKGNWREGSYSSYRKFYQGLLKHLGKRPELSGGCLADSAIRELAENSFLILPLHPHHEGGTFLVFQSKVGNKQTLLILSYLVAVNSRTSGKMVCGSQIVYDFGGPLTTLVLKAMNRKPKIFR